MREIFVVDNKQFPQFYHGTRAFSFKDEIELKNHAERFYKNGEEPAHTQ